MFWFIVSIVIGMACLSVASGSRVRLENPAEKMRILHFIFWVGFTALGVGVIIAGTFARAEETMKGTPLRSIGPGRYTVVEIVDKEFTIEGLRSSTGFLLQDEGGGIRFYLLPTEELAGRQKKGGTLEVMEVPSSTRMVLHE